MITSKALRQASSSVQENRIGYILQTKISHLCRIASRLFSAYKGVVQGVRAKFDSRRVFRKKQYISAKKADIFENQKVLIISVPRRQIATTVVPLAATTT